MNMEKYFKQLRPNNQIIGHVKKNNPDNDITVEYLLFSVDIHSFFKNELLIKNNSIEETYVLLTNNSLLKRNRILCSLQDKTIYMMFKDSYSSHRFHSKLENLQKKYIKLIETSNFFLQYHPDSFIVQAYLNNIVELSLLDLIDIHKKIEINNVSLIKLDNIDFTNIDIDTDTIHNYTISTILKSFVRKEIHLLSNFTKYLVFSDVTIVKNITDYNIPILKLLGDIRNKTWLELGEKNLILTITKQLKNYNKNSNLKATSFIHNNKNFFFDFKVDEKETLIQEYTNTTVTTLLKDEPTFIKHQKLSSFFKNNIFNSELFKDYETFTKSHKYIPYHRSYCLNIDNSLLNAGIDNLSKFNNVTIETFLSIFDPSISKKSYQTFLSDDIDNITMNQLFSLKEPTKQTLFMKDTTYNNTTNNMGGFALILLDIFSIINKKTKTFDFYKTVFSPDKIIDEIYQKKAISHIYFICENIFDGSLKKYKNSLLDIYINDTDFIPKTIRYEDNLFIKQREEELNLFFNTLNDKSDFYNKVKILFRKNDIPLI